MLANAKLPYVIHLLCPAPRNEVLGAFLPKTLNECPDSRGVGLLPCVVDAPYVLLIGNGAVGPSMKDDWIHYKNITLTVMYVNPPELYRSRIWKVEQWLRSGRWVGPRTWRGDWAK